MKVNKISYKFIDPQGPGQKGGRYFVHVVSVRPKNKHTLHGDL